MVEQLGNPFLATSLELIVLDTQNVMEHVIVTSLYLIREAGQTLHAAYVKEILEEASVPVSDTIKRNNILTFANRPDTTKKGTKGSGFQRQNMMLITQRFLLLHSRPDADMKDFQTTVRKSERHLALLIEECCDLGQSLIFLSASMHLSRTCCQTSHCCGVGYDSCYSYGATHASKDIQRVCVASHRTIY